MQYTYTRALSDEELLPHLLRQDALVLKAPGLRWQDVERQVERLGFGESFFVAATQSSRGERCRIDPVNRCAGASPDGFQSQPAIDG